MTGIIAWWARNSVAANLLMAACILAGVISFLRMEREVFPSFQINAVYVAVSWPGAAPQEVEEQIILRVEEAIADLDNIKNVSSNANEGYASITVGVEETADIDDMVNEVKARIDGISTFPADAFPPIVQRLDNNEDLIFLAVYGDADERTLSRTAETYRDELAAIAGGSPLVRTMGTRNEEVSIEVSEEALRRYGLQLDNVAAAVRASSLNLSSGTVRTDSGDVQLSTRNLAETREDFENIVVRQTPDGAVIRVKDVATVIDGFEDVNLMTKLNGKPVALITVVAPETQNVVTISRAVNAWFEEKKAETPEDLELILWWDSSELYFDRMSLVASNAIIGLILVMTVLILFLRPVVAFWVAGGIAVSFIGAFIFMPVADVSLNMLSLTAFLLVLGVVVDDAIIVGEAIHRQVEKGETGVTAAIAGAQLVAKPVIYAVLTTMIAFAPWMFISGVASQFTKHLTLTIVFALSFSLIESFLILPAHLAHMGPQKRDKGFGKFQARIADSMIYVAENVYRPIAAKAMKHRYATVAGFFMAFAIAATMLSTHWIRFSFMPVIENDFIVTSVKLAEGTPYSRSVEVGKIIEAAAERLEDKYEGVDRSGEDIIKIKYLMVSDGSVEKFITLAPADDRPFSSKSFADEFRNEIGEIPDADDIVVDYTFSNMQADIEIGIEADNLIDLRLAKEDIKTYLRRQNGTYDIRDNLQTATDEIQVNLKPDAERFGLTLAEVSRQVRQAYYGEEVQRLPRDGEDVRVMVRYPLETRRSLDSLENVRIRTNDGREIPIRAVADIEYTTFFKKIQRRDRQRTTVITAQLLPDAERGPIMSDFFQNYVPELRDRHPNVTVALRGEAEEQTKFMGEAVVLSFFALFAMYALLAVAFSSYAQPLLIMTAIPFGFTGAVFGHFLLNEPMALFSYFGIAAAAGVVVNDNLVLVDYVNRLRAQGLGAMEALIEAGVTRFRPILLTSVTTFIGLVPIMLEQSYDARFLQPMVISLAFGIFFATFLTLFFVPCMYGVGVDISRFFRNVYTDADEPGFGDSASARGENKPQTQPAE